MKLRYPLLVMLVGLLYFGQAFAQCTSSTCPTGFVPGPNLLQNGDFSFGNVGFATGLTYKPGNANVNGSYGVSATAQATLGGFAACTQRTTGNLPVGSTGHGMLVINGSPTANFLYWKQSVPVTVSKCYTFSFYAQNITTCASASASPSQLGVKVNGITVGSTVTTSSTCCNWQKYEFFWLSSDTATNAVIEIVNKNTQNLGANDLAIDDMSFSTCINDCATTCSVVGSDNLITNGDFSLGSQALGFDFETDGTYANSTNAEGLYKVVASAQDALSAFAACSQHTTGTVPVGGTHRMLAFNGSSQNNFVYWRQRLTVEANSCYQFKFWNQNITTCGSASANPAILQLRIDSVDIDFPDTTSTVCCTWKSKTVAWYSGTKTSITLELVNRNTATLGANDFALDDIRLSKCGATTGIASELSSNLFVDSEIQQAIALRTFNEELQNSLVTVRVIDVTGRICVDGLFAFESGKLNIKSNQLTKGIYNVFVLTPNQKLWATKVVVN